MLSLNATQLAPAIRACIATDIPLMVWSSPGIGKSDCIRQIAEEDHAQLVDIRLSMWDSVDMRGIPTAADGVTRWNPPAVMPFEGNPDFDPSKPIYVFFDELMQAMPSVQSVALQIALDRAMGEHKLMPNVRIIAASNRQSDRTGANRMISALANRFTHVEMVPHLDSWCKWAWGKDLNPLVIAFLRFRPDLISTFDPTKGDVAFATPRGWAKACKILTANLTTDVRYPLLAGTLGDGVAPELEAFMRVWETMPNIDGILLDPKGAEVPTDPSTLFAVTAALAQRVTKGNFDNVCAYAERLEQRFMMRCVKDCVKRKPEIQMTRAFNKFAVDHADVWQD